MYLKEQSKYCIDLKLIPNSYFVEINCLKKTNKQKNISILLKITKLFQTPMFTFLSIIIPYAILFIEIRIWKKVCDIITFFWKNN